MDAVDSIKKGDAKTLAQILSKPATAGGDSTDTYSWINQEIKTEGTYALKIFHVLKIFHTLLFTI